MDKIKEIKSRLETAESKMEEVKEKLKVMEKCECEKQEEVVIRSAKPDSDFGYIFDAMFGDVKADLEKLTVEEE